MTKPVIFGKVNPKYENETTNSTSVIIAPAGHSSSLCLGYDLIQCTLLIREEL